MSTPAARAKYRRYNRSPKGRARKARYETTVKGWLTRGRAECRRIIDRIERLDTEIRDLQGK